MNSKDLQTEITNQVEVHQGTGDSPEEVKKAIRAAEIIQESYLKLLSLPDGLEILQQLLRSSNPFVQLSALPYAFRYVPEDAEAVSQTLAGHELGTVRFGAKQALSAYRKGLFKT